MRPVAFSVLAGVLVLAAVVRFAGLGDQPLRIDEAFTLWLARKPLTEMIATIAQLDIHPPLHYLMQKAWLFAADSDAGFRTLSAMFSVLTVGIVFEIGRRLQDLRAGGIAAALVALSAWQVRYGQDARMYALETFLVAIVLLAAVMIHRGEERWAAYIGYGIAMGAALLVHSTSAVFLPLSAAYLLHGVWRDPGRRSRFAVGLSIALALWATWIWALPQQVRNTEQYLTWLARPAFADYVEAVRAPYAMFVAVPPGADRAVDLLVAGLVALALVRLRWAGALLITWWLAAPTAAMIISQSRPTFLTRTFLPGSSGFYVLLGVGAVVAGSRLNRRWGPVFVAAPLALFLVLGLSSYRNDLQRPDFRSAGQLLEKEATADDLVVYVANYAELPVRRYGDIKAEQIGLPITFSDRPLWEEQVTPASVQELLRVRDPSADVWLVHLRADALDPRGLARGALASELVPVGCHDFGVLDVLHFAPTGDPDPAC